MPRLLMCDDEAEVGAFVQKIAEDLGFEMQFTDHSGEFKRIYSNFAPDVIILDLVMPETDGIELLRFLAAQKSEARILVMSGFDPQMRETAKRLGDANRLNMVGTVPKPVRAAELRQVLSGLL